MSVKITMALARKNNEPDSNITYFYDNFDIEQFGLGGRLTSDGGVGIGLSMQRIADAKMMDFIKVIDPVVTHRLQRAFFQKKKFRKLSLLVLEYVKHSTLYSVEFEEITIVSLKQQFENSVIKDVVSIEAKYAELR
jgi:hypothetical protein